MAFIAGVAVAAWAALGAGPAPGLKTTDEENALLRMILRHERPKGRYAVVHPRTWVWLADPQVYAASIVEYLRVPGVDVRALARDFALAATQEAAITLRSAERDGYVVDADGRHAALVEKDGGGWPDFWTQFPFAQRFIEISRPVHDKNTGLVMVCIMEKQAKSEVILFRLGGGRLRCWAVT